jgi:putative addiction module component (TIGR02574 family)
MPEMPDIAELERLSVADRMRIVEELWDSIADEADAVEVTPEDQAELERRLAEHRAAPAEGVSWEEPKERLIAGR